MPATVGGRGNGPDGDGRNWLTGGSPRLKTCLYMLLSTPFGGSPARNSKLFSTEIRKRSGCGVSTTTRTVSPLNCPSRKALTGTPFNSAAGADIIVPSIFASAISITRRLGLKRMNGFRMCNRAPDSATTRNRPFSSRTFSIRLSGFSMRGTRRPGMGGAPAASGIGATAWAYG